MLHFAVGEVSDEQRSRNGMSIPQNHIGGRPVDRKNGKGSCRHMAHEGVDRNIRWNLGHENPRTLQEETQKDKDADKAYGKTVSELRQDMGRLDENPLDDCPHDARQYKEPKEIVYESGKTMILIDQGFSDGALRADPIRKKSEQAQGKAGQNGKVDERVDGPSSNAFL